MSYTPSLASLKSAGGMRSVVPPPPFHYSPGKTTPRDRVLIREIYNETSATRRELAWAFGVSCNTVYRYTS